MLTLTHPLTQSLTNITSIATGDAKKEGRRGTYEEKKVERTSIEADTANGESAIQIQKLNCQINFN